MIFVTLGSQKFQFNRLLKKLDELISEGIISEEVFAQIGYSDYIPKNYKYEKFIDQVAFAEKMAECDILITHGGTGAIIEAVKKGKKVIGVPRLAKYGEHVDDHQLQLLKEFEDMGFIIACYDTENLAECYKNFAEFQPKEYVSNTNTIINSIEEFLDNV